MKIADSKQKCNPEQISLKLQWIVDKLKANVQTAAADGESFGSVERAVLTSVLQIGNQALELLLSLQGDGDLGEQLEAADAKTIYRSEKKSKVTIGEAF